MSIDAKKLLEISRKLDFKEISSRLERIISREAIQDCPLILPLVGEFSSGKTTLINSLTDSKALETATKPTTATIFEVHFGAEESKAEVVDANGEIHEVSDISSLKNSYLADVPVITVFDTSKNVPSSIVLVDTPGLSSPDPRHRQTLVDFIPQADAILLVADINAQLTRSLIDFVKTMSLTNRRIYLVLTKADTKSASEIEASKKYVEDNLNVSKDNIVCVSASEGNVAELLALLEDIQKDKAQILAKVDGKRLERIAKDMTARIDELLQVPDDVGKAQEQIAEKKLELNRVRWAIDNAISQSKEEIEDIKRKYAHQFEETIFGRLEALASGKSKNFDKEAVALINNTASIVLNNLKNEIRKSLHDQATKSIEDDRVDTSVLDGIDVSELSINGLSYNLELNKLGHEYDGYIATGIKLAAVAAAVVVTAGTASGAAAGAAGAEAAGAVGTEVAGTEALADVATVASIADTATDVGSMVSNSKLMSKIEKVGSLAKDVSDGYSLVQNADNSISNGEDSGGIVKSVVGFFTDKAMGKPQRRKAIHNYLDETLMPQFKSELDRITDIVTESVRQTLSQSAEGCIKEMTDAIEALRDSMRNKKDDYEKRMGMLRDFKNELALM